MHLLKSVSIGAYIKFGIRDLNKKCVFLELVKKEIASIKMLVVHLIFFSNSLFYRSRITLDFFVIYVTRRMIQVAIHFSESGWFYNKHIKSHIFYKNVVLVTQKNSAACCPVFCNLWFMQEYAEFQYRRRHRQRRRGDMHSLLSNTPDPEDPSESTLGTGLSGLAPCSSCFRNHW